MRDTIAKYELPGGVHMSQGSSVRERNDEAVRRARKYKGMMRFVEYAFPGITHR